MDNSQDFADILVFLFAAIAIVPLFHRFHISPILGYLTAGIIIGPHGFKLITDSDSAHTLAEFGVVFLLFMIGLDLSLERLRAIGKTIFLLGLLQIIVTTIIIGFAALSLGFSPAVASIIGGGLALSSTAFVMKYLTETGERATKVGLIVFTILLVQDLAAVPFLILVQLLGTETASFFEAFASAALKGTIALAAVLLLGRFLLNPLYKMVAAARNSELFVSTTLLVVLGTGWLMSLADLSMTLGAFLAGLMLSGTQYRHQVAADIRPFRGLLLGLFFMIIGMSIDLSIIAKHWLAVSTLLFSFMAAKTFIIIGFSRLLKVAKPDAIRIGLALSQGGEFGFIMFGAALALGLMDPTLASILSAAIALSMILTPAMFSLGKLLVKRLFPEHAHPLHINNDASETPENFVLIAGFGRVGQTVAKVLSDAGISYVALDQDLARVDTCRAKNMSVFYGDAGDLRVLKSAGIQSARAAIITLDQEEIAYRVVTSLRKNYEDLPIYVRARDRAHTKKLEKAGATAMVSEAAEASLQLGSIVLASLDVSTDEIASVINAYREDDYAGLDDIIGKSSKAKR